MSFRTIVIQNVTECSEESENINMYTSSSGIQILRRKAPLDDK